MYKENDTRLRVYKRLLLTWQSLNGRCPPFRFAESSDRRKRDPLPTILLFWLQCTIYARLYRSTAMPNVKFRDFAGMRVSSIRKWRSLRYARNTSIVTEIPGNIVERRHRKARRYERESIVHSLHHQSSEHLSSVIFILFFFALLFFSFFFFFLESAEYRSMCGISAIT